MTSPNNPVSKLVPGTIIFFVGVATMSFEIAGARILGPYFGTSIIVWTGLIGVIMGSLSLGYWIGGKVSIYKTDYAFLSLLLIASSVIISLTTFSHIYILDRIVKYIPGLKSGSFVSSVILFGPVSCLFGMVLPYGIKLSVKNPGSTGTAIGKLYALSTFGSILGTFITGFFVLPAIGFQKNLYLLSALLLVLSLAHVLGKKSVLHFGLTFFSVLVLAFLWIKSQNKKLDYIDLDTMYNRVLVFETRDKSNGRNVKILRVNNENSSAMYTDDIDELAFEVLKYYHLVEYYVPEFQSTLMIGGSGYAYPRNYLTRYPGKQIKVVEIDPGLTQVAKEYFNLSEDKNLSIVHEDGRTYLNQASEKFDAIFMDAYKSMLTIPFQLTTKESVEQMYRVLNDNGAVFANVISSMEQGRNNFLLSQIATYKSVFPMVHVYAVQYPNPGPEERQYFQNFMIVGLKSDHVPDYQRNNPEILKYLAHKINLDNEPGGMIFTDEYAPVEYLASRMIQ
ncbi:MAG: fused MFS/spermidine synthase [Bacteroidales bacterium]|nr:fused MFS/spermidine synthase [Bacteroidales bacterium]MCF8403337.1 fused MFS/spermidine synthase [Bacteroidales bacterium]